MKVKNEKGSMEINTKLVSDDNFGEIIFQELITFRRKGTGIIRETTQRTFFGGNDYCDVTSTMPFRPSSQHPLVEICTGSLMDGLSIDIFAWAGLNLSDAQRDKIASSYSDLEVLRHCVYCDWEVSGEVDEIPGQSDEFYSFTSNNIVLLKEEIAEVVRKALQ